MVAAAFEVGVEGRRDGAEDGLVAEAWNPDVVWFGLSFIL